MARFTGFWTSISRRNCGRRLGAVMRSPIVSLLYSSPGTRRRLSGCTSMAIQRAPDHASGDISPVEKRLTGIQGETSPAAFQTRTLQ